MAVPSLTPWAVGNKITDVKLDERDTAIEYLMSPPRCQIYNGSGQSISNSTLTVLSFDTAAYDYSSMHDAGSPTRVTIPDDGLYLVHGYVRFSATGVTFTRLRLQMRINGATVIHNHATAGATAVTDDWISLRVSIEREFQAGDYLELLVIQTSGASRTTDNGNNLTGITARWVATA